MLKKPIYNKVLKEALGEVPPYRVEQDAEPFSLAHCRAFNLPLFAFIFNSKGF